MKKFIIIAIVIISIAAIFGSIAIVKMGGIANFGGILFMVGSAVFMIINNSFLKNKLANSLKCRKRKLSLTCQQGKGNFSL